MTTNTTNNEIKTIDGLIKSVSSFSKGNLVLNVVYRIPIGATVADWVLSHYKVTFSKKNIVLDNLNKEEAMIKYDQLYNEYFKE